MLSLQLCWRIKANLANCNLIFPHSYTAASQLQWCGAGTKSPMITPTTQRTFRNMYWQSSVLTPDMITSFLSYLLETDLALCCRQLHQQPPALLQCEHLPLTAPASAHSLGLAAEGKPLMSRCSASHQTELTTGCAFHQKLSRAFSL